MLAKFAKLIAGFLLVSGLAVCDPCNGQGVAMQFVPQERVLNLPVRIQYEIPEIVQYANLAGAYSAPCGTSSYAYGAGAYSAPIGAGAYSAGYPAPIGAYGYDPYLSGAIRRDPYAIPPVGVQAFGGSTPYLLPGRELRVIRRDQRRSLGLGIFGR